MKQLNSFLFFVILVLSFSCQSKPVQEEEDGKVIDFGKNEKVEPANLLATIFVPLQTNDSVLLGGINQLETFEDKFFVLDVYMSRSLYVFGKDGTFISKLGKRGTALGEYVHPISFSMNREAKTISVIDMDLKKVLHYSLDTFQFIEEKKLPFNCFNMEYLKDGNIVWYNDNVNAGLPEKHLIFTDKEFEVLDSRIDREFVSGIKIGTTRKLYIQQDTVVAYSQVSPVLYRLSGDSICFSYRLKFADYQMAPVSFYQEHLKKEGNYIPALRASSYIYYYDVYENNRLMCVPYFVAEQMRYGFYDKKTGLAYDYAQEELQNSLGVGAFSSPVGVTADQYFVSLLRPGLLKDLLDEGMKLDDRLEDIARHAKVEDNPILLLYKRKD